MEDVLLCHHQIYELVRDMYVNWYRNTSIYYFWYTAPDVMLAV